MHFTRIKTVEDVATWLPKTYHRFDEIGCKTVQQELALLLTLIFTPYYFDERIPFPLPLDKRKDVGECIRVVIDNQSTDTMGIRLDFTDAAGDHSVIFNPPKILVSHLLSLTKEQVVQRLMMDKYTLHLLNGLETAQQALTKRGELFSQLGKRHGIFVQENFHSASDLQNLYRNFVGPKPDTAFPPAII